MKTWLRDRPWIWILVLFLAFLGAWAIFITIAVRNAPEAVPPVLPSLPHES